MDEFQQDPNQEIEPAIEPKPVSNGPEHGKPTHTPKEMAALYPELTHYFGVFDPENTKTFSPPIAKSGEARTVQSIEKKPAIPWAVIAAVSFVAAVILYFVLNGVGGLPGIG